MSLSSFGQADYTAYHRTIRDSEQFITQQRFQEAMVLLDSLFAEYDFLFLRDIKLAAAASAYLQEDALTQRFLRLGMRYGWTWKAMRKVNGLLRFHIECLWLPGSTIDWQ